MRLAPWVLVAALPPGSSGQDSGCWPSFCLGYAWGGQQEGRPSFCPELQAEGRREVRAFRKTGLPGGASLSHSLTAPEREMVRLPRAWDEIGQLTGMAWVDSFLPAMSTPPWVSQPFPRAQLPLQQ